jgi:hypothetical protein
MSASNPFHLATGCWLLVAGYRVKDKKYILELILILIKGFFWTGFTGFSRLLSRFPEETVKTQSPSANNQF